MFNGKGIKKMVKNDKFIMSIGLMAGLVTTIVQGIEQDKNNKRIAKEVVKQMNKKGA